MTTFFMIRHGATAAVGRYIAGRSPGVALSQQGRREADVLAAAFDNIALARIYSSPLDRARRTAAPLAAKLQLDVVIADELNELDFGDWTGKTFSELDSDPRWKQFNTHRSGTCIPAGESMLEVQSRIVGFLHRLRDRHSGESVALVSHCGVIRAAVLYVLGMPLDLYGRIEISPASVTTLRLFPETARLLALNAREPASG